jgi:hypothetical protein
MSWLWDLESASRTNGHVDKVLSGAANDEAVRVQNDSSVLRVFKRHGTERNSSRYLFVMKGEGLREGRSRPRRRANERTGRF